MRCRKFTYCYNFVSFSVLLMNALGLSAAKFTPCRTNYHRNQFGSFFCATEAAKMFTSKTQATFSKSRAKGTKKNKVD